VEKSSKVWGLLQLSWVDDLACLPQWSDNTSMQTTSQQVHNHAQNLAEKMSKTKAKARHGKQT
jgi:hypothetical protein